MKHIYIYIYNIPIHETYIYIYNIPTHETEPKPKLYCTQYESNSLELHEKCIIYIYIYLYVLYNFVLYKQIYMYYITTYYIYLFINTLVIFTQHKDSYQPICSHRCVFATKFQHLLSERRSSRTANVGTVGTNGLTNTKPDTLGLKKRS